MYDMSHHVRFNSLVLPLEPLYSCITPVCDISYQKFPIFGLNSGSVVNEIEEERNQGIVRFYKTDF